MPTPSLEECQKVGTETLNTLASLLLVGKALATDMDGVIAADDDAEIIRIVAKQADILVDMLVCEFDLDWVRDLGSDE